MTVQDMALYLQAQIVSAQQSTQRPSGAQSGDQGPSFKDLLDQKHQSSEAAGKDGQAAQDTPGAEAPEGGDDKLDVERLQLMAAAQAAMAPVQQMETAPVAQAGTAAVETVASDQLQTRTDVQLQPAQNVPTEGEPKADQTQQAVKPVAAPVEDEGGTAQAPAERPSNLPKAAAPVERTQTGNETREARPEVAEVHTQTQEDETTLLSAQTAEEKPLFTKVETTPVKVADAPVVDTQKGDMEAQLAGQVDSLLEKGGDRVELKLSPGDLGTVTVELTRSQDGSLHVALSATNGRATELLEKHAAGLENILAGNNRTPVQVEVQRGQENQQSQNGQQPYDREGQSGQNRQQNQQQRQTPSEDFIQQLRLGLFPIEGAAS